MQPEIRERPAFNLLGLQFRVDPGKADYGDIWGNRYAAREADIAPLAVDEAHYAGYFCTGEGGLADLLVGRKVQGAVEPAEGLVLRPLPAALEAVFTCTMQTISSTWNHIYSEWMPASGFERDPAAPDFECFPPGVDTGAAAVEIHVPVRRRG